MDVDQDPGSYRAKKYVIKVPLYKRHLSFFLTISVLFTMYFLEKMHDTKSAVSLSKFIDVHFFTCSFESTYHKVPFEQLWEKSLWGKSVKSGTEKWLKNISFGAFISKLKAVIQMFMGEIIEYPSA